MRWTARAFPSVNLPDAPIDNPPAVSRAVDARGEQETRTRIDSGGERAPLIGWRVSEK